MTTYTYEKYVATPENAKEILDRYGVAIVPNVLNETECEGIVSGMWDFLETISQKWQKPISRSDQSTWSEFFQLFPMHSMLIQHYGVGHMQGSWNVRQNEKVADVFAKLWNCSKEELLVSFDGCSFHMPPEITKRGWNRNHTWFHVDQSFKNKKFSCIQGWVTGLNIEDGDSTLAIFEGSHKLHAEMAATIENPPSEEWYKLNEEQEQFYLSRGCTIEKIKCPKGSLVLWDSRTVHCGIESERNRLKRKFRAVVYVCYMPRSLCNADNLKKKQKAFYEQRTTRHNPCKIGLFGKMPRTYGKELPEMTPLPPPVLTPFGMKLAGILTPNTIKFKPKHKTNTHTNTNIKHDISDYFKKNTTVIK